MRCSIVSILLAAVVMIGAGTMGVSECFAAEKETKMLRHVVLFKFKADAGQEKIDEVTTAFAALPKKIEAIKDFEWGTDVSVENKTAGFTHCFVVTFADEKGREVFLPHPAHKEFVKLVGPVLEDVLVVDYWAK